MYALRNKNMFFYIQFYILDFYDFVACVCCKVVRLCDRNYTCWYFFSIVKSNMQFFLSSNHFKKQNQQNFYLLLFNRCFHFSLTCSMYIFNDNEICPGLTFTKPHLLKYDSQQMQNVKFYREPGVLFFIQKVAGNISTVFDPGPVSAFCWQRSSLSKALILSLRL